ncbi:hypothetical protein H1R20_g16344, partial [Candolleomyces eurysporus]
MNQQYGKRPRRSGGSATGELSPTAAWRESKRPRILSKVHTTLQGVSDPTVKSACHNKLSREEKAVLEELATALSPRGSRYPNIGKSMPSQPFEPPTLVFERVPTVSHIIEALNKDEIDISTVLLDRLDQDLRRLTLNATSVLRMMELTDTVISGSFVHPVISRGTLVPNDLDLFTTLRTFGMVLSYFRKKGYADCKEVYPQGSRRPAYRSNLKDISFIFELRNKKVYKINVIVSKGRPLLPILQFHSTPVMNYIAYHGLVCLYDITIYQLGINNYVNPPARVQQCIVKYEHRGFEIWDRFEEEHTCKIDGCCAQTIRSLFDRDMVHFQFPDSAEIPHGELRKSEAEVAVWRLATGAMCKATTNDDAGFVICDSEYTGKALFKLADPDGCP